MMKNHSMKAAEGDLETIERDLKIQNQKSGGSRPAAQDKKVSSVPEGYTTVTPYISLKDAVRAVDFYKRAFGAVEMSKFLRPNGELAHAVLRIGNAVVMVAEECPEYGGKSPEMLKGTSVNFYIYVDDADAAFKKAIAAGAKETSPMMDQFYGDRSGQLTDPFGHIWWIATQKEYVAPEEINRRLAEMSKKKK